MPLLSIVAVREKFVVMFCLVPVPLSSDNAHPLTVNAFVVALYVVVRNPVAMSGYGTTVVTPSGPA